MDVRAKDENVELFYRAVLQLQSREECERCFEDICTVQEVRMMAQRIVVAKMLADKRVYNDIVEQTGASTATISRVKRSMSYGNDTYSEIFRRLEEQEV